MHRYNSKQLHILCIIMLKKLVQQVEKYFYKMNGDVGTAVWQ